MEEPEYRQLMNTAMRALSRRAHTTHELREKLKKKPHWNSEREEAVIRRLEELGLLNDEAFVQRSVEEASQFRLQGRMKLASRLLQKGIPTKVTESVWHNMGISEKELAGEAIKRAAKRFAKVPKEKLYQRKAQFLASRGFSPDVIYELAKTGLDEIEF